MSIELKYLCSAQRKHPDDLWMTAERNQWTHLWRMTRTSKDVWFLLPPVAWILTHKMVLRGMSPPSSWATDFLNKVAIPCPNNPSLDLLAWHEASSMTLALVTRWEGGEIDGGNVHHVLAYHGKTSEFYWEMGILWRVLSRGMIWLTLFWLLFDDRW